MTQMNLFTKQKQTHRQRTDLWLPRGRCGGGMNWKFGIIKYKLLYVEWINNKALLYSTGNSIQYPVRNHHGKEYLKENVCVCVCVYVCVYIKNRTTLLYSRN